MRIEIVVRDENPVNERFTRTALSLEAVSAMSKDVLKDHLLTTLEFTYHEMTGEDLITR